MIFTRNLVLFIVLALWHNVPFLRWAEAWRGCKEAHRQWVHKEVWELKKEGKIREDKDGYLHDVDKD